MNILFLHPHMPGQFLHLAPALAADKKNRVVFVTQQGAPEIRGVHRITYKQSRTASEKTHRYLTGLEKAILQGQIVWRVLRKLQGEGFTPDVIVAHPGWGDALFVKDRLPKVKLLNYFEFFYHATGADVGFDPEYPATEDDIARLRIRNSLHLINLEAADAGLTPTEWQFSLHPKEFQHKLTVLHEGVDTDVAQPDIKASFTQAGQTFTATDEVITFINRRFEPYRGFHTFMRAAKLLLKKRPNLHILMIGEDGTGYGRAAPQGTTFREMLLGETGLKNHPRLHFTGKISYAQMLHALQVSSCHVYLTYPFVLSWSLLEAMSCGCPVVASDTVPVKEVITHGKNGLLVDFFFPEDIASGVLRVLDNPKEARELGQAARKTIVDRYALKKLLPQQVKLVQEL